MMRRLVVCLMVIFFIFSAAAYAQYQFPEPSRKGYIDMSLGYMNPTGTYNDDSLTTEIDFKGGFSFAFDFDYYFNDYVGINMFLALGGFDSEDSKDYTGMYLSMMYTTFGVGLALKYDITSKFEIFAHGGLNLTGASYDIKNRSTGNSTSQSPDSGVGVYMDGGLRLFLGENVYLLGKARYVLCADAKTDAVGGDITINYSYLTIAAGVGFAF